MLVDLVCAVDVPSPSFVALELSAKEELDSIAVEVSSDDSEIVVSKMEGVVVLFEVCESTETLFDLGLMISLVLLK